MDRSRCVALTLLVAAVCAIPARAQEKSTRVLAVTLVRVTGDEPVVVVDRPAYIAVFEMVPGAGIAQLYPLTRSEIEDPVDAGMQVLLPGRSDMSRRVSFAASRAFAPWAPAWLMAASARPDPMEGPRSGGIRHVVAIASDRPLRVSRPDSTIAALHATMRSLWRPTTFAADDADLVALVARIRPELENAEVDVAVLTLPLPLRSYRTYLPITTAFNGFGVMDDEILAVCFGAVVSVPRSYVHNGVCSLGPVGTPWRSPRARDGELRGAVVGGAPGEMPMAPPVRPGLNGGMEDVGGSRPRVVGGSGTRSSPGDFGAGGGRDIRPVAAGWGFEQRGGTPVRAGAVAAPMTGGAARAPTNEGSSPKPAPGATPVRVAPGAGPASRERPVP